MKLKALSFLATFVSGAALAAPAYVPGDYEIDPAHSKVGFSVAHLVISTVEGRFTKFSGKVDLAKKFQDSKFAMSVDTGSVDTSNAKRDEHLRSPDFFDVKNFPEMKFTSSEVKGTPEHFRLSGELTIRGVTKKVSFDAQYLGSVKDGFGNQKAALTAKTKINRKDFGLKWGGMIEAGPVVGDEVTVDMRVEAGYPLEKK